MEQIVALQPEDLGQFNNGPRHNGVYVSMPTFVDLALTMSDDPDPVYADSPLSYNLLVTNNGSGMAHNVVLSDTLPTATAEGG